MQRGEFSPQDFSDDGRDSEYLILLREKYVVNGIEQLIGIIKAEEVRQLVERIITLSASLPEYFSPLLYEIYSDLGKTNGNISLATISSKVSLLEKIAVEQLEKTFKDDDWLLFLDGFQRTFQLTHFEMEEFIEYSIVHSHAKQKLLSLLYTHQVEDWRTIDSGDFLSKFLKGVKSQQDSINYESLKEQFSVIFINILIWLLVRYSYQLNRIKPIEEREEFHLTEDGEIESEIPEDWVRLNNKFVEERDFGKYNLCQAVEILGQIKKITLPIGYSLKNISREVLELGPVQIYLQMVQLADELFIWFQDRQNETQLMESGVYLFLWRGKFQRLQGRNFVGESGIINAIQQFADLDKTFSDGYGLDHAGSEMLTQVENLIKELDALEIDDKIIPQEWENWYPQFRKKLIDLSAQIPEMMKSTGKSPMKNELNDEVSSQDLTSGFDEDDESRLTN